MCIKFETVLFFFNGREDFPSTSVKNKLTQNIRSNLKLLQGKLKGENGGKIKLYSRRKNEQLIMITSCYRVVAS